MKGEGRGREKQGFRGLGEGVGAEEKEVGITALEGKKMNQSR